MMLSTVPSAVRIETPLSVATPLRRLTRQPSSFAPLVKAVPSAPSYQSSSKVSNCVASVVTSTSVATDVKSSAVTSAVPSSRLRPLSRGTSFASTSICTPQLETRRIMTAESSSCLDVRDRRSSSCQAALTRTASPIMRRTASPVRLVASESSSCLDFRDRRSSSCIPASSSCLDIHDWRSSRPTAQTAPSVMNRTASPVRPRISPSSPLMHSRVSIPGTGRVKSWHSSAVTGTSVACRSESMKNLGGSMVVPSGSSSVALPSGNVSVTLPSGSASVALPVGRAIKASPSGSASVALPLGNCLRASGSAARLPSVDRMFSMAQEEQLSSPFVDELDYDTPECDPSAPKCHRQLVSLLGLTCDARIEPLLGQAGGLNKGLWAVSGSSQALILKLVSSRRNHPMLPTEAESFLKLSRDYPSLLHDRELAFPLKIFHCRRFGGSATHDLIVMRKAPGESFSDVISRKWKGGRVSELMMHFEAAGKFLASIHNRYGLQHGDFQPNNLFYDEATNRFTMIDLADLSPNSFMVQESDVEHFCRGVGLLSSVLGDQLQVDGLRHFQAGYNKSRAA